MARRERPTSPHLQIYAWGAHMALSIFHRATGVALGAGTLLLVWWLGAMATGEDAYAAFQACMGSIYGQIVLFGFTVALMLHMCNGIRHLFWDAGKGFELDTTRRSNMLVFAGTVLFTGIAWVFGLGLVDLGGMS